MKPERDYQRSWLYRSEWELHAQYSTLNLHESWRFLAEVIGSEWFCEKFPATFKYLGSADWTTGLYGPQEYRPNGRLHYLHYGDRRRGLKLRPGYRRRHAESCGATITLPVWSRNPLTLLHELAHVCCWMDLHRGDLLSAHGKEFAGIYLTLVEKRLGVQDYEQLAASMREHKVKILTSRFDQHSDH
jgi:hypothetical protein